ncbi:hypothetical protein A2Z33_05550 [Candidatus Gottesmanbacteria bacterium RBG_16_52_11]|uniref:Glycosyl transferase family 1 domain-containing protein n=1 Tax=Candidatus Gottesmanbacteria bacterium RBG_16_52_11 TaxID=1798374 RepID=A0A1F5YN96_9BACT|nr:MAG: hypothetical protein A2Z33_05550 [Candidatus Gottesmanbacteria bacterium RBG_16_52_11]
MIKKPHQEEKVSVSMPKSCVIVCHDWTPGPPHRLRDFLIRQGCERLLFIGHRNRYITDNPVKSSYFEVWENGRLARRVSFPVYQLPELFQYIADSILTIYWTIRLGFGKSDYFFGAGNLNTVVGILLRFIKCTRFVIYYVIDFADMRFGSNWVRRIYRELDRFAARFADTTWNFSGSMIAYRMQIWGKTFVHQQVVPHGSDPSGKLLPSNQIRRRDLVYLGIIRQEQGLDIVIESMPGLIRQYPDCQLHIIGAGPYQNQLVSKVKRLRLKYAIRLYGYVKDENKIIRKLARSGIGVAMYSQDHSYSSRTDSGKIKSYLSAGLPVITTVSAGTERVENQAKFIYRCGNDIGEFTRTVQNIFRMSDTDYRSLRRRILAWAGKNTWDGIFRQAFEDFPDRQ